MTHPSPEGDPALHRQPTPEVVTVVILGGWQAGLRGVGGGVMPTPSTTL